MPLEQQVADQARALEQYRSELVAARADIEKLKEATATDTSEAQIELFSEPGELAEPEVGVDVSGFFDLTFFKSFLEDRSAALGYLNANSTFLMSNVNLYFSATMTASLNALVELRFTSTPNGQPTDYTVYLDGSDTPSSTYKETSTLAQDPYMLEEYWLGGVKIERAQLVWSPREWLNFMGGKFLTPYGIWNVEHASTVIIPSHLPYQQQRAVMPPDQLGLQVFGRVFLVPSTHLDYAVTVSNGRLGLYADENGDRNENKAVGLGLSLRSDLEPLRLEVGGYGYYGKVTQSQRIAYLDSAQRTLSFEVDDLFVYDEVVVAGHALLEAFGVRLQSECVWTRGFVDKTTRLTESYRLFLTGDLSSQAEAASYYGWSFYGLLAYRLPLGEWIGAVQIIPYVMYEKSNPNDNRAFLEQQFLTGGVNVRPSPFVALKLEYTYGVPKYEGLGDQLHQVSAQAAVSF